jgi:DNA-binding MarR family transcriptional regulator
MFGAIRWVRENRDGSLDSTAMCVAFAIAAHADKNGYSTVGTRALAEITRLSRHTILSRLRRLEAAGLLATEKLDRGSRTVYRFPTRDAVHKAPPAEDIHKWRAQDAPLLTDSLPAVAGLAQAVNSGAFYNNDSTDRTESGAKSGEKWRDSEEKWRVFNEKWRAQAAPRWVKEVEEEEEAHARTRNAPLCDPTHPASVRAAMRSFTADHRLDDGTDAWKVWLE